jgi:hypothetical protein
LGELDNTDIGGYVNQAPRSPDEHQVRQVDGGFSGTHAICLGCCTRYASMHNVDALGVGKGAATSAQPTHKVVGCTMRVVNS